jgi:two-component system, response regulator
VEPAKRSKRIPNLSSRLPSGSLFYAAEISRKKLCSISHLRNFNDKQTEMSKSVVLLDEDRDDWSLVKETVSEIGLDVSIQYIGASNELFDYLKAHQPSLILLDYNALPDNGLRVLQQLKSEPAWKEIPVVILSDSADPYYKAECYGAGAATYIKKPDSDRGTREKISTFFKYWFEVAEV